MKNNVNVFSLSGEKISSTSALDDVEFKSYKHESDEEYRKVLTSASQEGIAIVIEGDEPSEEDLDAAVGLCFGVLGNALILQNLIPVDYFPKTIKGTPDRKACAQLALVHP